MEPDTQKEKFLSETPAKLIQDVASSIEPETILKKSLSNIPTKKVEA